MSAGLFLAFRGSDVGHTVPEESRTLQLGHIRNLRWHEDTHARFVRHGRFDLRLHRILARAPKTESTTGHVFARHNLFSPARHAYTSVELHLRAPIAPPIRSRRFLRRMRRRDCRGAHGCRRRWCCFKPCRSGRCRIDGESNFGLVCRGQHIYRRWRASHGGCGRRARRSILF